MKDVKLTDSDIRALEFLKFVCCLLQNYYEINDYKFTTYFGKCMRLMIEVNVENNLHLFANLIICWSFSCYVKEWNEYMLNHGFVTSIATSLDNVTNRLMIRHDDAHISIDSVTSEAIFIGRFLRYNVMHNLCQLQVAASTCNDVTIYQNIQLLILKMGNWKLSRIRNFVAV